MNIVFLTTVLFSSISRSVLGLPFLTCRHVEPISTSSVQCSCYNPGGSGISWNRDGSHLTQCFLSGEMCYNATDYTFAVNSSSSTYMIEFGSYSYTNCSNVSCSDSENPTESDMKSISVDESQLTPKLFVVNEPSNHTDGIIIFTTDCLYKATATKMNVSAKWTAVTNKGEYILDVDSTISEIGSCQSCSYDFASNFSIDFHHKEDGEEIAQYRLQLYVDETPIPSLSKTTNNFYNVKVRSETSPDSIWCLICIIIIIIIVGVTLYYVIVVKIWFKYRQEMKSSKASKCFPLVPIYGICYICGCGRKSKIGITLDPNLILFEINKAQPEKPNVCHKAHETEIFLEWAPPACRGNPPLKYLVKWGKFKQKEVTTTNCNIDKLNPAEKYDIEVYAINNERKSIPWKNKIRTNSVTLEIKIKDPCADHCIIQWTTKTIKELELKYMVEYCWAEGNDWIKYGQILNARQTCLESLLPNKKYKIRVYAIYKSKVLNPPGKEKFVTTLDESPNTGRDKDIEQRNTQEHNKKSHIFKVSEVRANYDITVNRCDITWNVERSGKPLSDKIQYMLEYTLNNGREWNKQGIILDEPETCLESLERNKYYEIHVYAIYHSFIQEVPGKANFSTQSQSSNPLPPIKQSEGRHQAGASVHK